VDNARLNSKIKKEKHKFPICVLTSSEIKNIQPRTIKNNTFTIMDYYNIEDCVNSLERLRNYQLSDILGKYKLF